MMNFKKEDAMFSKLGFTPWDHQMRALNKSIDSADGFGFFMEIGTGKTLTSIQKLRIDCFEGGGLQKILITAPVIMLDTWRKELLKFSNFKDEHIYTLYGPQKDRIKMLKKLEDRPAILITNYATFGVMKELMKELTAWSPDILLFDESQRLKSPTSKQTKAALKLSKVAKKKYLLSGTPILNSLEDLWSQFMIIDGGFTLGKSLAAYRNTYFTNVLKHTHATFPKWVEKEGARDVVKSIIANKCLFVEKSECLDLPPYITKTIEVDMGNDQKKAYKEMKKELIAFISDSLDSGEPEAAVATLAMTKALRLLQITCGFVGTETLDGRKKLHRFKSNPKKIALKELLSDVAHGSKVIVWSIFRDTYGDIEEVCKQLKLGYVFCTGDQTKNQKDENLDVFRNDEECKILIGNQQAMGVGVTVIESNVSVYYSRNFSLELDLQSQGRNYRGGSDIHEKVTRYDLNIKNSIDSEVSSALQDKQQIGLETLRGIN
jgi:SNF2 family DNA or RNA helicase